MMPMMPPMGPPVSPRVRKRRRRRRGRRMRPPLCAKLRQRCLSTAMLKQAFLPSLPGGVVQSPHPPRKALRRCGVLENGPPEGAVVDEFSRINLFARQAGLAGDTHRSVVKRYRRDEPMMPSGVPCGVPSGVPSGVPPGAPMGDMVPVAPSRPPRGRTPMWPPLRADLCQRHVGDVALPILPGLIAEIRKPSRKTLPHHFVTEDLIPKVRKIALSSRVTRSVAGPCANLGQGHIVQFAGGITKRRL